MQEAFRDGLGPILSLPAPKVLACLGTASVIGYFAKWYWNQLRLSSIPTVGYSNPLLSFITAFKFITQSREMIKEGYEKYNPGIFKVANLDGWFVIAAGKQYIDEVRRAPDDVLSFHEATERRQQIEYTLGPDMGNGFHIGVIKTQLTRNLTAVFDDIRDETIHAFDDIIPTADDGAWVKVQTQDMLRRVICRVSNRLFVGLPLCRNPDWIKLNVEFTINALIGALLLQLFPVFLKPIVGRLFTKVPAGHREALRHCGPIIEERRRMMAEYGDKWEDRPNDFLQWMLDEEIGQKKPAADLSIRILGVNFAAIHTSSLNMTQALYHLASDPEYQRILREEVEEVTAAHGWSKASVGKMWKVDSFLKESQRLEGLGILAMGRIALKPFTFSNGVHVPTGAFVACVQRETHHDETNYADPDVFDPWRFSRMRTEDGEGTKHQLVSTSTEFVNFGHGRHACPGRFFAANELKTVLAHIVLNYDVAFESESCGYPPNRYINANTVPADVNLLFRKRQA